MKDEMPEEKLSPCPLCGGKASLEKWNGFYVRCVNTEPCGALGLHDFDTEEQAIKAWNTRRPAEKLVPLDKVKIYHLIKKYFLMIPGDDRPTNILQDTALDDACDEICARFGSVPVVPKVTWPEMKNTHVGSALPDRIYYENKVWNECLRKCKTAFNEAVRERNG